MRTAPPSDFVLTRFGLWRGGLAVLCAVAAGALAAWLWPNRGDPVALAGGLVGFGVIVAALMPVVRRPSELRLRWAASEWFVVAVTGAGAGPYRSDVPLDLGIWMLLRLRAEGLCTLWIPAQRRGHEDQWHGLRRAVYFPRPTVGGSPGAEPHLPE